MALTGELAPPTVHLLIFTQFTFANILKKIWFKFVLNQTDTSLVFLVSVSLQTLNTKPTHNAQGGSARRGGAENWSPSEGGEEE